MARVSFTDIIQSAVMAMVGRLGRGVQVEVERDYCTNDTVVTIKDQQGVTARTSIRDEDVEDHGTAAVTRAMSQLVQAHGVSSSQQMLALQHQHAHTGTLAGSIGSGLGGIMGKGGSVSTPPVWTVSVGRFSSGLSTTTMIGPATGAFQLGGQVDDDPFEMNGGSVATKIMRVMKSETIEAMLGGQPDDRVIHMIAREIIRIVRTIGDEVFEKADVNPKYHRENFVKVIDAVMREL